MQEPAFMAVGTAVTVTMPRAPAISELCGSPYNTLQQLHEVLTVSNRGNWEQESQAICPSEVLGRPHHAVAGTQDWGSEHPTAAASAVTSPWDHGQVTLWV